MSGDALSESLQNDENRQEYLSKLEDYCEARRSGKRVRGAKGDNLWLKRKLFKELNKKNSRLCECVCFLNYSQK